jgi:mono/diheme cytochrome c family protein
MRSKIVAVIAFGLFLTGSAVFAADEDNKPLPPIPKEYADKHMPKGGWTDPAMLAAGKKIFEEKQKKIELEGKDQMVACGDCHGRDGKPKKRGVKNMSSPKIFNRYSDSFWFWRISEGVPKTKMKSWKDDLTEEQRWQVMAYEHTFSHGGKAEIHEHPEIGK